LGETKRSEFFTLNSELSTLSSRLPQSMRLADEIAVITGAGSGIGRAIARRFADEGARVIALGRRLERLQETIAPITARGASAMALACDVADRAQVERAMQQTVESFGRLDILVNNAAQNRPDRAVPETVADLAEEWWTATLDVNLTGYFHCCQFAVRLMRRTGGGCIINVASTSGLAGNTNQSAYTASKHGVIGLTKSIALDYGRENIRANAICPGLIETERSLRFGALNRGPDWLEKKRADIPLGRLGQPDDVASLAVFLASDEAAFITGAAIPIDGGTAARR